MISMKTSLFFILTFNLIFTKCYSENRLELNLPSKLAIIHSLEKVTDWQIENFTYSKTGKPGYLHDYGIDAWTNATLYIGMTQWCEIAPKKKTYYDWLYNIGEENDWTAPSNFIEHPKYGLYHADELCILQFYMNMYDIYNEDKMLNASTERIDYILNNPPDTSMIYKNKQTWTWSDALFMAPPVYVHLSNIKNDPKYLRFMDEHFKLTYNHLYDKDEKLFFRDDSYFGKVESNGEKVFWGRGNGWVVAGLANILKLLPHDSEYRPFYEDVFKELLPQLASMQDSTGFWHASLLDPESYPSPETSATALITYALAYGINNDLLDAQEYYPYLEKGWNALLSSIDENGKLGWVQPIGADPRKVTKDMTAVYGVGAFLMAGTEMYKLTDKIN